MAQTKHEQAVQEKKDKALNLCKSKFGNEAAAIREEHKVIQKPQGSHPPTASERVGLLIDSLDYSSPKNAKLVLLEAKNRVCIANAESDAREGSAGEKEQK